MVARGWGKGKMGRQCFMDAVSVSMGDEKVPELGPGDDCTTL